MSRRHVTYVMKGLVPAAFSMSSCTTFANAQAQPPAYPILSYACLHDSVRRPASPFWHSPLDIL